MTSIVSIRCRIPNSAVPNLPAIAVKNALRISHALMENASTQIVRVTMNWCAMVYVRTSEATMPTTVVAAKPNAPRNKPRMRHPMHAKTANASSHAQAIMSM